MKNKKYNIYLQILKSSLINFLLIFLLVLFLVKVHDGFENPQILQREYYYFYPELFDELPPSIENTLEDEVDASLEHDQNHWMPVTEEEFGLMGDTDMETPYLMEELYLVQDDIRDIKVQQEVIKNDLGITNNSEESCTDFSADENPCNGFGEDVCDFIDYCEFSDIDSSCQIKGIDTLSTEDDDISETDDYNTICSSKFNEYGGISRNNCPIMCKYKKDNDASGVNGSLLFL